MKNTVDLNCNHCIIIPDLKNNNWHILYNGCGSSLKNEIEDIIWLFKVEEKEYPCNFELDHRHIYENETAESWRVTVRHVCVCVCVDVDVGVSWHFGTYKMWFSCVRVSDLDTQHTREDLYSQHLPENCVCECVWVSRWTCCGGWSFSMDWSWPWLSCFWLKDTVRDLDVWTGITVTTTKPCAVRSVIQVSLAKDLTLGYNDW